jgi:hypothetical protein
MDSKQAQTLLGTEIEYRADSFRWKMTNVPSSGSSTNMLGAQEFARINPVAGRISTLTSSGSRHLQLSRSPLIIPT